MMPILNCERHQVKHPAYHLRTNKAVDRLEWIRQISKVIVNERKSEYFSLGGPFLEDMKLVHSNFPGMRLTSIESNAQTFNRQKFHKFCSKIELYNKTIEDFLVHDYEPNDQAFFWLDFTELSTECFRAFRTVLTVAPHKSLIRLTLRAEPSRVLSEAGVHLTEAQKLEIQGRIDKAFSDDFGAILSHDAPRSPLCSASDFARTVQLMARRIASEALDRKSERDFKHISTARYDDGSQMISITGIVLDREQINESSVQLKSIGLPLTDWPIPGRIDVPILSLMERQTINKVLPSNKSANLGSRLAKRLKYNIDNGEKRSAAALEHYADHYLAYPSFLRVDF